MVRGPVDGQLRKKVRLMFLAVMCLETGMPYGGRIEVAQDGDSIIMNGHEDKFKIDGALWAALKGSHKDDDLRPAQVQFRLLPFLAEQDGFSLDVDICDDKITNQF